MANKKIQKLEAHDAAGYETAMETFDGADDGYGNRVEHGDLSMQRTIERGGRQPWHAGGEDDLSSREPTGYDTHPWGPGPGMARSAHPNLLQARGGKVAKVMHEYKAGTLHSGSGDTVTDRKQALAIALAEARRRRGGA